MELLSAYEEVKSRIDRIDFSALWAGFAPFKFALYTGQDCVLDGCSLETPDTFVANTSLEYEGEHIAIWSLLEFEGDFDSLAASIVHEMFHAFQNASGECRWADEKAALFDYRYAAGNISMKISEASLMKDVLVTGNGKSFAELLALRRMRADTYPAEYDYEARVEQIEGSANYVELKALSQLNPQAGASAWENVLSRLEDPANYTPIRQISYYVGAALLRCIDTCTSMDYCQFDSIPYSVKVIEQIAPTTRFPRIDPKVSACIDSFAESTRRIVQGALSKHEIVLQGAYPLCSLNIWDARWDGTYAISNYFVSYYDGPETKVLYGNFVIELGRDRIIRTVYNQ